MSTIYNSQLIYVHRDLILNISWLFIGNFNAIISNYKHRGGSFCNYATKSPLFSDFTSDNQLINLVFSGPNFTWCNNQNGLALRWPRLELFLANSFWILCFHSFLNFHLSWTNSDFSPLFLTTYSHPFNKTKIFRFENFWLEYEDCHNSVFKAWNIYSSSSPMQVISHSFYPTKSNFIRWRKTSMSTIDA